MTIRWLRVVAALACLHATGHAADESVVETLPFGKAGNFHTGAFAAISFGDPDGEMYTLHGDLEWFLVDHLAIAVQPFVGFIDGETDDAGLVGVDLLLKWYALRGPGWSIFLEGGAGAQYAIPYSFPDGGSHFNFRPQVGIGTTIHLFDNADLLVGGRYLHISNGGTIHPNQGYDAALVYGGLMIQF